MKPELFPGKWNVIPGIVNNKGIFIKYDMSYYCNINKVIHNSRKEYLTCKHCKITHNEKFKKENS